MVIELKNMTSPVLLSRAKRQVWQILPAVRTRSFLRFVNWFSILPANNEDDMSYSECEDDLNRICSDIENCVGATDLALAQISDDNFFMEVKKDYDPSMVTGFIRLNGMTVGCVANRTEVYGENGVKEGEYDAVLSYRGCEKAEKFVSFCDAFNIPLLTLVNVKGYKASKCTERRIAKAAGRLTYAFADASVRR